MALAKEGVDGIVHILPFTCMPEIVAQSVLPLVSRDYQIPILTIVVDEHSAEAGIQTRLEAFVIFWPVDVKVDMPTYMLGDGRGQKGDPDCCTTMSYI